MKIIVLFIGISSGFDVGLISRHVPTSFSETDPFHPGAIDGAQAVRSGFLFLEELVKPENYASSQNDSFLVPDPRQPISIKSWSYYWSPVHHPPLANGTAGCKIPIKSLVDILKDMDNSKNRFKFSKEISGNSMEKILRSIHFSDGTAPTEIAWSCTTPINRCCGIGCCSRQSRVYSDSLLHSVFGYMCGGFMLICILILILSLVMFLCNDVWHRYIPWFPTSPRPPATPREEAHEMTELNPTAHRSPSRLHLAV
ncbi:hypothetical protein CRE_11166 [Caenorhabditis remanei]|uniref:CX domain-containing protein n=1 Tax=Caenorhabditis remanei TaxID=31234 RepID=E3MQ41_CAERE|nr:hypothetical protein CRE_11166 [Caenorhabditis remanei]